MKIKRKKQKKNGKKEQWCWKNKEEELHLQPILLPHLQSIPKKEKISSEKKKPG